MTPSTRYGVGPEAICCARRREARELAAALAAWAALAWLPGWLMQLGVAHAPAIVLCGLLLALVATRGARRRGPVARGGDAATCQRAQPRPARTRVLVVWALGAGAGALAMPAATRVLVAAGRFAGLPLAAPQPPLAPLAAFGASVEAALCALLLGPCVEELVYRERLLNALRRRGPGIAIAGTALPYALAHADAWTRLAALASGVWLGAAMWRTGSLALCIGLHTGLNAAVLGLGAPARLGAAWSAGACALALALHGAAVRLARGARRDRLRGGAVLLLGTALAAPALADVKVWEGRLRFEPLAPAVPAAALEGRGVATLDGSGSGVALETLELSGGIAGSTVAPISDPLVTGGGVVGLGLVASLGAGRIAPFQPPAPYPWPQLTRAALPVSGELRLCVLFTSCSNPFGVPLSGTSGGSTVGLGVGGMVTAHAGATVMLSLFGAPWTLRTASLPITTSAGASFFAVSAGIAHGPASFTGSTAVTGGALRIVSPVRIDAIGDGALPSGFAHLEVRFLPEPGSLPLLGPGVACLALAVRLRRARGDHA